MMIDSLYDIVLTNTTTTFAAAMEVSLKGIIEFEGSHLRLYYSANEAEGVRDVNGTYSIWRVGYSGQIITLGGLLPPLLIIAGVAIFYVILGARTKCRVISSFVDPMSSTWLVAASATGGTAGRLQGLQNGIMKPHDARILSFRVGFEKEPGLVTHSSQSVGLQEFLVGSAGEQQTAYKGADNVTVVST